MTQMDASLDQQRRAAQQSLPLLLYTHTHTPSLPHNDRSFERTKPIAANTRWEQAEPGGKEEGGGKGRRGGVMSFGCGLGLTKTNDTVAQQHAGSREGAGQVKDKVSHTAGSLDERPLPAAPQAGSAQGHCGVAECLGHGRRAGVRGGARDAALRTRLPQR